MNKAIIMGRLTKDPEVRYTTNDKAVCSFTIAVDRKFKKDEADFIPVVAWDKTAEFCAKYFSKGRKIAVSGRIQTRTYDDNDGKKHYVTEIVAEEVDFADSKKESNDSAAPSTNTKAPVENSSSKNQKIEEKPPWA
jgi:single-strand DNA-binding protein